MKTLVLVLICGLSFFHFSALAAEQPCGADAAVTSFQDSINDAISLMPALDGDVDKCFNPSHASYLTQTHATIQKTKTQYQNSLKSLDTAYDSLQRGQDADFITATSQIVTALTAVNKPLLDNAANLKNYGFTTSDSKLGNGQYKYPLCNSKTNDHPEKTWASTYSDILSLQKALKSLQDVSVCLKK